MKMKASGPITSWKTDGETMERVRDFILGGSKITAAMTLRCLLLGKKVMTNLDSILKSNDITLLTKILIVKAMVFPVVIYGCESWTIKKSGHWKFGAFELWCWRKILSPLDCKEIKPVNPNANQSWTFIGRADAEAETPILWSPDVKNRLTGKDLHAGKVWRQEKGTTKDEVVGWHHQLDGHEFEQSLGVVLDRKAWHAAVYGVTKSRT